ncbi:hypothetical protein DLAC_00500 [Tieghemostelium lacteum]|uniref:Uncharacterized protein n=1 Tax=Tieghemostelium lacteum TaxID=361077 RepID=A0A152A9W4_TIELA|nr:hypothetical protein DLAC_00500 [Tieghemostelium lacteum]|eukprot:KYR03013.1 hypothetical protein DLAC_00500 [Tieghemostelium lacteum]
MLPNILIKKILGELLKSFGGNYILIGYMIDEFGLVCKEWYQKILASLSYPNFTLDTMNDFLLCNHLISQKKIPLTGLKMKFNMSQYSSLNFDDSVFKNRFCSIDFVSDQPSLPLDFVAISNHLSYLTTVNSIGFQLCNLLDYTSLCQLIKSSLRDFQNLREIKIFYYMDLDISQLCDVIARAPAIESMYFESSSIDGNGKSRIISLNPLNKITTLTQLTLRRVIIKPNTMVTYLDNNKSLKDLNIILADLTSDEVEETPIDPLIESIEKHQSLKRILVSFNRALCFKSTITKLMGSNRLLERVVLDFTICKNPNQDPALLQLTFSNTCIRKIEITNLFMESIIANHWNSPSTLEKISLIFVDPEITKSILLYHKSLKTLKAGFNFNSFDSAVIPLLKSQSLTSLSLHTTSIVSNAMSAVNPQIYNDPNIWNQFINALKSNCSLRSLSLKIRTVPNETLKKLFQLQHPTLKHLSIWTSHPIGIDQLTLDSLCKNSTIQSLSLNGSLNKPTEEHLSIITKILNDNRTLQSLSFYDLPLNSIHNQSLIDQFSISLKNNSSLKIFNINTKNSDIQQALKQSFISIN